MWLARPLELQPQLLSKRRYQLCRGIDRGSLIRDRRVTAEHAEISYEPETSHWSNIGVNPLFDTMSTWPLIRRTSSGNAAFR